MDVLTRPVTYDDIRQMPDVGGDRYEIIGGELCVSPSPTTFHQTISLRLTAAILDAVVDPGRGFLFYAPTDVKFSEHDVVVPDLAVVAAERREIIAEACIVGAPDVVVEIFSPSTQRWDQIRKTALFAANGVREYWQVDPQAKRVTVLALREGILQPTEQKAGSARSFVFPELTVDTGRLFADLP
jgi:Uma2 family endonuclease